MIFRPIKFQIVHMINGEWKRDTVEEMLFDKQSGVNAIKTFSGLEIPIDPMQNSILQFTGQFDKDGKEIYHAHLLVDEVRGDVWEVVAFNGNFHLHCGEKTTELSNENCMLLKIVGDSISNKNLQDTKTAEEILADSQKRNPQRIVRLKKKNV